MNQKKKDNKIKIKVQHDIKQIDSLNDNLDKLQKTLQHLPKKEVKINKLDVNIKKVESKNLNEKEKLEE